jgi:hypothetical protein
VYVFLRNPTGKDQTVDVEVRSKDAAARWSAPRATVSLKAEEPNPVRVEFSAATTGAAAPADKRSEQALTGPLEILVRDNKTKELLAPPYLLTVSYLQPRDYIDVVVPPVFVPPAAKKPNQLSLKVHVRPEVPLNGPPCRVEMRHRIEGFVRQVGSTPSGQLDPSGKEVTTLSFSGLEFDNTDEERTGIVYLNVDGYERAFAYPMRFPSDIQETGRAVQEPRLLVKAPPYVKKGAPFNLVVETLYGLEDTWLDILQKLPNSEIWNKVKRLDSDRSLHQSYLGPSEDGALQFELTIKDWSIRDYLNTRDLSGEYGVRVRLMQGDQEKDQKTCTIMFDETAPEEVQFVRAAKVRVPARAGRPNQPITVDSFGAVELEAEGRDPESKIKEVVFFLGEPEEIKGAKEEEDKQRPPKAPKAIAKPPKSAGGRWTASLFIPVPPNPQSPQTVSVEFVNGAGMRTFDTIQLQLPPPVPANGGPKKPVTGSIAGIVRLRGEMTGQPNLVVELWDPMVLKDPMAIKVPVASTKTDASGTYEFLEVKPGKYVLYCKRADAREDQKPVIVTAGEKTDGELKLGIK